jgi:hypothetical protein
MSDTTFAYGAHEFDAACGAVFGMRLHPDLYTDGDIVRAVVRELFYIQLDNGGPGVDAA